MQQKHWWCDRLLIVVHPLNQWTIISPFKQYCNISRFKQLSNIFTLQTTLQQKHFHWLFLFSSDSLAHNFGWHRIIFLFCFSIARFEWPGQCSAVWFCIKFLQLFNWIGWYSCYTIPILNLSSTLILLLSFILLLL